MAFDIKDRSENAIFIDFIDSIYNIVIVILWLWIQDMFKAMFIILSKRYSLKINLIRPFKQFLAQNIA